MVFDLKLTDVKSEKSTLTKKNKKQRKFSFRLFTVLDITKRYCILKHRHTPAPRNKTVIWGQQFTLIRYLKFSFPDISVAGWFLLLYITQPWKSVSGSSLTASDKPLLNSCSHRTVLVLQQHCLQNLTHHVYRFPAWNLNRAGVWLAN